MQRCQYYSKARPTALFVVSVNSTAFMQTFNPISLFSKPTPMLLSPLFQYHSIVSFHLLALSGNGMVQTTYHVRHPYLSEYFIIETL